MRLRDAAHVDLGSFYARNPGQGKPYRLLGYAACVAVLLYAHDPGRITGLGICLLVAWVMAWYRCVGALWRTSLVTALVFCAAVITADRLGYRIGAPPARPVVIEVHQP